MTAPAVEKAAGEENEGIPSINEKSLIGIRKHVPLIGMLKFCEYFKINSPI